MRIGKSALMKNGIKSLVREMLSNLAALPGEELSTGEAGHTAAAKSYAFTARQTADQIKNDVSSTGIGKVHATAATAAAQRAEDAADAGDHIGAKKALDDVEHYAHLAAVAQEAARMRSTI